MIITKMIKAMVGDVDIFFLNRRGQEQPKHHIKLYTEKERESDGWLL